MQTFFVDWTSVIVRDTAEELERHINGVSEHYVPLHLDDFRSAPLPLRHHSGKFQEVSRQDASSTLFPCHLKLLPSLFAVATQKIGGNFFPGSPRKK
jgi:hypothetical protein